MSTISGTEFIPDLPSVPDALYEANSRPQCLDGTRVTTLETIRAWGMDPESPPILWLRGQAGMGKTTIALSVADECRRRDQLGASFFFSRDEADRNELRFVFPTIAHQLGYLHDPYKAA